MRVADVNPIEPVIAIRGLTRRFGAKTALDAVNLNVPRGTVFGLVGVNGAGKTTLIRHILGLLKAQSGTVRIFGRDPVADPVGVLSRVATAGTLIGLARFVIPEGIVSSWLLVCGVVLMLPLVRLSASPLALAWNRHR